MAPRKLAWALPLLLAACGGEEATRPPAPPSRPVAVAVDAGATDPLGARPALGEGAPYTPPVPVRFAQDQGFDLWVLERHSLPIVSVQIVVPAGAAEDPEGKAGLASMTANMLDEGAGKRSALDISQEIDRLGATLRTGAYADYAYAQLTVLKKNLAPAVAIFGDVVTKPQLSAGEYKRVHDLWENQLRARQSEPDAVAGVVVARRAYPAGHPYAHPTDGLLASAPKVTLDDVKKFYAAHWRSDRAVCVVVGDVSASEIDGLLKQTLGSWLKPAPAATKVEAPPPSAFAVTGRKVVIVDRADAPQSVIAVARPGVAAADEDAAALVRVNTALGGSYTSRLNQDLREEHGWTYGANSRFSFTRRRGLFVAQAAVQTEHTGEALKAMLADIDAVAKGGLTDEEVGKTKQRARADLVEAFETVEAAAARLGRNAGVGLARDHEALKGQAIVQADKGRLAKAAAQYLDLTNALVVVVGPRAKVEAQIKALGIGPIEISGPEGQ